MSRLSAPPRLAARALRVRLEGRAVLHDLSCTFANGWTAIVGPNGAGKSTLLRALAGLLRPDAGEVMLEGRPLKHFRDSERAQRIAWLPQQEEVTGELTVQETVALGRLPHRGWFGGPAIADHEIIRRAMQAVACEGRAHRLLRELSGGERQRVLLARALATEAPVLLLDEPTTFLDPPQQVMMVALLQILAQTRTVVTVVHDLTTALQADRLLLLRDGCIHGEGRCDDPALWAQLSALFDDAVAVRALDGQRLIVPRLGQRDGALV